MNLNRPTWPKRMAPGIALLGLMLCPHVASAATSAPVGDILLFGRVERSGRPLSSETTLFEGDSIRTHGDGGGVVRLGKGRLELRPSTDLEIVSAQPLRLILRAGALDFNFPAGTEFEIITPQLAVRPGPERENVSGEILAVPEDEDRVESRKGLLSVLERQEYGASRKVEAGEVLIASLVPTVSIPVAEATFTPPQAGSQIAQFEAVEGDVRLTRVNTTLTNRVENPGLPLFSGDTVATLQGRADIRFTDQSLINLDVGTTVVIEEEQQPTGILRRIGQTLGSLFFDIQEVAGTETELTTPTAVAAIRGTEGKQLVPNDTQSTHQLNEGLQQITENITGQSATITGGQQVIAIRGVGLGVITALVAPAIQAAVGSGVGGAGGAGGGGAGAGGGGAGGGGAAGGGGGAAGGAGGGAAGAGGGSPSGRRCGGRRSRRGSWRGHLDGIGSRDRGRGSRDSCWWRGRDPSSNSGPGARRRERFPGSPSGPGR